MVQDQPEGTVTPQRFISENRKKTAIQFLRPGPLQSYVNKSQQLQLPVGFQSQRLSQFGAFIDPHGSVKKSSDRISYVSSNTARNKLNVTNPALHRLNSQGSNTSFNTVRTKMLRPPKVGEKYTHYLFIFANPRSGDQKAAVFLKEYKDKQTFQYKFDCEDGNGVHFYAHIFNVVNAKQKREAYKLIQKTYEKFVDEAEICIVLMGGDGGLMRAMEDLRPLVNIAKLTFVPLPFGSGNDLA